MHADGSPDTFVPQLGKMIFLIIFGLVFLVLGWVLLSVFRMEVDSLQGFVRVDWGGVAGVVWIPAEAWDILHLRMLGMRRQIRLGEKTNTRTTEKPVRKKPPKLRKGTGLPFRTMVRLAVRVLRTFRVRRCRILWDSGDFVWNAWAWPVAHFLNTKINGSVGINFVGKRDIHLVVENRLGSIAWAVFRTWLFKR